MCYSEQHIRKMEQELGTIPCKYQSLLLAYNYRRYQTVRGKEFATHGFLRRLGTLRRCIERVFTLLPFVIPGIPTDDVREDATIALQAFIFNVFGCMDNLAWVWVEEKAICKRDGAPLALSAVGFGEKYASVWQSFPEPLRVYLQTLGAWFKYLEDFRHALAHRIPLYIPPFAISPEDQATYSALETQITDAMLAENERLATDLRDFLKSRLAAEAVS